MKTQGQQPPVAKPEMLALVFLVSWQSGLTHRLYKMRNGVPKSTYDACSVRSSASLGATRLACREGTSMKSIDQDASPWPELKWADWSKNCGNVAYVDPDRG